MKTPFVVVFVLAALLAGCSAQETLTSSGTGETKDAPAPSGDTGQTGEPPKTSEQPSIFNDQNVASEGAASVLTQPTEPTKPDAGVNAASLAGNYTGALEIPQSMLDEIKKNATPEQLKQYEEQIKAFEAQLKTAKITLELKNDGTYEIVSVMGAMNTKENGNWTYNAKDNTVVIEKPKPSEEVIKQLKARGMTDDQIAENQKKPIIAQVSPDGKTIHYSNAAQGGGFKVTFTKN